eukprot:ANDGO_06751.mRNA.1 Beta-lactamase-like protein 3
MLVATTASSTRMVIERFRQKRSCALWTVLAAYSILMVQFAVEVRADLRELADFPKCTWTPIPKDLDLQSPTLAKAFAAIDAVFEEHRELFQVPATVYGIVYKGKIVHAKGVGLKNVSNPASGAPDAATLFRIGSITKLMTALNSLHDVYEQCMNLDMPVQSVLKNFNMQTPFVQRTPITFRDLMGQAAGLPRMAFCDPAVDSTCNFSNDEALTRIRESGMGTYYTAGFRGSYSNPAFSILGHASEYACGRNGSTKYADIIKANLFTPWNMQNTGFDYKDPSVLSRIAVGLTVDPYTEKLAPAELFSLGWDDPAGSAYSNVNDLLVMADHLMNGLSYEDQLLTSPNGNNGYDGALDLYLRREFFRPSFIYNDNVLNYGFPAEILPVVNATLHIYTKDGAIPGYESMIAMQPDMDLGFAILSGRDNGDILNITLILGDMIVGAFIDAIAASGPYNYPVPPAGNPTTADAAVGTYWVSGSGLSAKIGKTPQTGALNLSIDTGYAQMTGGLSFVQSLTIKIPYFNNSYPFRADIYRFVSVKFPEAPTLPCVGEMSGFAFSELVFVPCASNPSRHCSILNPAVLYGKVYARDDSKQQPPFPVPPSTPPIPNPDASCPKNDKFDKSAFLAAVVVLAFLLSISAILNFVQWFKFRRHSRGFSATY